jgi:hypothetical protein
LSLAVKVKFKVLANVGTFSHVGAKFPAKTSENFGKKRVGEVEGEKDLKLVPVVEVAEGTATDPGLFCSQH